MSAPERIWLDWPEANKGGDVFDTPPDRIDQAGQTEYVRADHVQALIEAEREACAKLAHSFGAKDMLAEHKPFRIAETIRNRSTK